MPKKGKKTKDKKDKKGKKKGQAKEETITKMIERNASIWEAKLKMTEYQKDQYKDSIKQLAEENTSLIDYMKQSEKDSIDVVAYLRKLDAEKENEIAKLKHELKHIERLHEAEKEILINSYNNRINEMQDTLDKKDNENELIQNELNQLKEFRKKKIQMQKELEDIKEAMNLNEKEHKEQMTRVEEKFLDEKMRLQKEANKKIDELAEKAHDAAIKNLDEITRNIYKENVQLTESYKINNQEIEMLKKHNKQLRAENEKLRCIVDDNSSLVRDKVDVAAKQAKQIKDLQNKVEILEKSLSQVVREFETERENMIKKCRIELESSSIELDKLRRTLELKSNETNKIKKLAKNILQQRSDIEHFFLDSLDYVRKQILINRTEYRKEASQAYNNKMLAAHLGQIDYPKVRTFSKRFDAFSTNSVYRDLEQAEKWNALNEKKKCDVDQLIDLNDLTWEQKEQVLRELFARINGNKIKKQTKPNEPLAIENSRNDSTYDSNDEENDVKFLNRNDLKRSADNLEKNLNVDNFTFITQPNPNVVGGDDKALSNATPNSFQKLPSIKSS